MSFQSSNIAEVLFLDGKLFGFIDFFSVNAQQTFMLRQFTYMNIYAVPGKACVFCPSSSRSTTVVDLRLVAMTIMNDLAQSINIKGSTAPCALIDRVAGEKVQKKERKREGAGTGTDLAGGGERKREGVI